MVRCSDAELKFGVKLSERRDEKCQEEMERDHRVRDPEPAEERVVEQGVVEAQDRAAAGEEWAAIAREQDLRAAACVPPVGPKLLIQPEHHVMR